MEWAISLLVLPIVNLRLKYLSKSCRRRSLQLRYQKLRFRWRVSQRRTGPQCLSRGYDNNVYRGAPMKVALQFRTSRKKVV